MKRSSRETMAMIGGGNMAEALLRGLITAGTPARRIHVAEPRAARRRELAARYGVAVGPSNSDAVKTASIVILAVKPQTMSEVLAEIAPAVGRDRLVVSIAAGIPIATIEAGIGGKARVVRVMPNTPCLVGKGMSVLARGRFATVRDLSRARVIFETVGKAEIAKQEAWLDAVTGLSGSGPAYVYRFAEGLIEGGLRVGLPEPLVRTLVYQTLCGAAEMLVATAKSPRELREAVSSPGGTTLAGLARMDRGGFVRTVSAGVVAATARSKQLARAAR
jgi:pyrroline-5-carboxylate reductase